MKNRFGKILPLLLAVAFLAALFSVPVYAKENCRVTTNSSIFHLKIDGSPVVGGTLTLSYDLYDPAGKETNLENNLTWQIIDKLAYPDNTRVTKTPCTLKGKSITVPAEAEGKYMLVQLVLSNTPPGYAKTRTLGVGPILASAPQIPQAVTPTIQNVGQAVGVTVGEAVQGHYLYAGQNAEGASRYSWSLSDTEDGTYTPISDATAKTYTPKAEDVGKYLRFSVTPADSTGAEGVETHSVTQPIVGSASYGASVSGEGGCRADGASNGLTNGIETIAGGGLYTYGLNAEAFGNTRDVVLDLGEPRMLDGARIVSTGSAQEGVWLSGSLTAEADSFQPIYTTEHNGTDEEEKIAGPVKDVTFKAPVQARYVQVRVTLIANRDLYEFVLKEALPTALSAQKKVSVPEALSVAKGASEAEVRTALADKLDIKATYGTAQFGVPLDKAALSLDTGSAGTQDMTLSYKGQTATVSVQVDGSVGLESLTAAKNALYKLDLEVPVGATEEEIRLALDGAVDLTAHYSGDRDEAVDLAEASFTLDTAAAGTKDCIIGYGGQTATLSVKVVVKKRKANVYGLYIEGAPVAGETLTFHYTLDDPDGTIADFKNQVAWYYIDKHYGVQYMNKYRNQKVADKTLTYTIPNDGSMDGKYIQATVKMPGNTGWGLKCTIAVGPILADRSAAPQASTVTISSMGKNGGRGVGANVGQTLRGEYYYTGEKPEGESTYQWYRAASEGYKTENNQGMPDNTVFTPIEGATGRDYTIQEADRGKYLKFTVLPKDQDGAAGTAVDSISRPLAGNVAYQAMVDDGEFGTASNNCYEGTNLQTATNGVNEESIGGAVMAYTANNGLPRGVNTVDLGKIQTLTGARLTLSATATQDDLMFYTSTDGVYWYPAATTDGLKLVFDKFRTKLGGLVTFTNPLQARYLQIRYMRTKNNHIKELQAFIVEPEPALQLLAAEKKDPASDLKVKQNADAAAVRTYLMENVTVKATYAGEEPLTVLPEAADYTLNTAAAGTVNAEISFRGLAAHIPVEVEAPALTKIEVAKAQGVGDVKVWKNADAAALKSLLADKIVITATYEDGSTGTIPGADASYSGDTSVEGPADITVSYGGKTATLAVTVEGVSLTKIEVAKATGVQAVNIWQNTDAAGLKAALADKIVITATYSDNSTDTIANAEAAYSADTSRLGAADVTVSYGGKTATISVNIQAPVLTHISVTKAQGVTEIKVPQNTDAAGLKTLLADKIVITGTYSDGSEKPIANADANYSGNTAAVGVADVTVSYGGQTATVTVTVEEVVTLTGISVAKAQGVGTIEITQNTDAAGLKTALADKIVITAHYSNTTTQTVANADASYSGDTSAVGAADITVTYQGKTATIGVTVVEPVVPVDVDPSLFGMRITGTPVVGGTLTFEYELYDPMGKEPNVESKVDWQVQSTPYYINKAGDNQEKSLAKGTLTYTVPEDQTLIGNYIAVNVQMTGLLSNGRCRTIGVGPILAAQPEVPGASSVTIVQAPGRAKAGSDSAQTLMGDYLYTGAQPEGESAYQWYISEMEKGPFTEIAGATDRYYTPRNSDRKKYLQFRVTPKDTAGGEGKEASSINAPQVGNAAYRAYVFGTGRSYTGCTYNCLTNGITSDAGGAIFTYGSQPDTDLTIDLGQVRTLDSAAAFCDKPAESVGFSISMTGEEGSFTPILTAAGEEKVPYSKAGDVAFAQPVRGRYVKVASTCKTNVKMYEVALFTVPDEEPVITLEGGGELKLLRGEPFADPGFTATDKEDGDLTARVTVTGAETVDTSTVGSYEITYTVTDSKPQTTTVVRRILVADGYQAAGDLAFQRPVTADGTNAASLVDGNKFTSWQAGSATSAAVIDLGGEELVSNAVLMEEGNAVTGYIIEVSADGSSWKTAHTGTTVGAQQTVNFEPVSGRYVRLRFTGASSAPGLATFEIRFDDLGKVKAARDALTIAANLNAVTEDLPLLEKGLYDTVITWKSNNASAVTDKGIVRRGDADQNAVLTATVTLGEASVDKTFPVKILKKTGSGGTGGGGGGRGPGGGNNVQVPGIQPETNLPDPPENPVVSGQFKDVPDTYWAKNYIESLAAKGIVNGKENGVFDAEGTITRAEFLKMIVQVFDLKAEKPAADFTDVSEEDWYYSYVAIAAALGITGGVGDGSFGAAAPITRQDMAVLVARAAQIAEKQLGQAGSLEQFSDAGAVSEYAREALSLLTGAGIIGGDDAGALCPADNATRAQAAKILCLVLEQLQA